MTNLRPARASDVVKFTRYLVPEHFVGIVCEEGGEVIGLGAIIWGDLGRPWVVLDVTPQMREKKLTLHRVGQWIVRAGSQVCGDLYVMQGEDETAGRWLHRLGFRPTGETHRGKAVLKWQK